MRIRKAIAVFLLLNFTSTVIAPSLSYALTAGPTAPEATSFEPVDTTDLVDLKTGDFNYNVPLLEVPGPGGGYPLSLSYHAGIFPDQEASWTGLGFNVSPGAITRLVNGYPDDHFDVKNNDRVFWEGGSTTTGTVGISYGISNMASVSADLVFANDTYKGRGVGGSISGNYGYSLGGNSKGSMNASVNASIGITPYGDPYYSVGAGLGVGMAKDKINGSLSMGINYNSLSGLEGQAQVGMRRGKQSLVGISMSTQGSKPHLSVAGATAGVHNSKQGHVSVDADNFAIEIPLPYYLNLRLGRSYQRYWIDETASVSTFGSLYSNFIGVSDAIAYDNYDLPDIDLDVLDFPDPEKTMGGTFPEYDVYTVTAQGLGGNIRPYHFKQDLYRQNKRNGNLTQVSSLRLDHTANPKPQYRFINDFSNRIEYDPADIALTDGKLSYDFAGETTTGPNGNDGFSNNHLAGSKHVQWFTNREIIERPGGVDPYDQGFINGAGINRPNDTQVGGFVITKSDGVTYHYALPVYSFDEFTKTVDKEQEGLNYNTLNKPAAYAYEWLLTAVTGPDFVDRNNNGLADQGDWGYWVNFQYDQWLGDYKWRNPGEGRNEDIDGQFEFYSYGKKQIYYLSKIITGSHAAIFEKSERIDGREVMDLHAGGFEAIPQKELNPDCYDECTSSCQDRDDCVESCTQQCEIIKGYQVPRATLKLDRISLFSYQDYATGKTTVDNALRVIDFGYDYSLVPGTPNSYSAEQPLVKQGRLTLKTLAFKGKKGVSLIPPMNFSYSKNPSYLKDGNDMWGYYKSDYKKLKTANLAHFTTLQSAANIDAWSLSGVETSLGAAINIRYESDSYKRPILYKNILSTVSSYELNDAAKTVKLNFSDDNLDLTTIADVLKASTVKLLLKKRFCPSDQQQPLPCIEIYHIDEKEIGPTEIGSIEAKSVTVKGLYELITKNLGTSLNYVSSTLVTGHILLSEDIELPGGGLRVRELEYTDNENKSGSTTLYEYAEGTTTYEPVKLDKVRFEFGTTDLNGTMKDIREQYLRELYSGFSKILLLSRHIPAPGVLYKQVTVKERVKENDSEVVLPNRSVYEFEVFKEDMVDVRLSEVQDRGTVRLFNIKHILKGPLDLIADLIYDPDDLDFRSRVLTRRMDFKDYTARIGNLKSITLYAEDGSPVSKTENHYLHDAPPTHPDETYGDVLSSRFKNQGVTEESFTRGKMVLYAKEKKPYGYTSGNDFNFPFHPLNDYDYQHLGVVSKRVVFPSVLTSVTNTNYKTGIVSTTENLAFDFYSGETTKVLTSDSYGNRYISETIPAYALKDPSTSAPVYPEMGLKINDVHNRNMLTQPASSVTYKVNENNEAVGLLSASVQTWSNQARVYGADAPQQNIWRMQESYAWNGTQALNNDGTYPIQDYNAHAFNWANPKTSDSWEKTGEVTLYDVFSNPLESTDINGNFISTRTTNDHHKVIAHTINASFNEMASAGAEFYAGNTEDEGGVNRGEGNPTTAHAHTGKYSLLVGYGSKGFNYTLSSDKADLSRKYKASVWLYAPGTAETAENLNKVELYVLVDGVEKKAVHAELQKNKSKSWYLLNLDIDPGSASEVYVGVRNNSSRGVYLDDFRVCPVDAILTSYVYDTDTGELSFILDAKNFYTKYEYDAMGRLIRTSKELLNFDYGNGKESFRADRIVNESIYNYGQK